MNPKLQKARRLLHLARMRGLRRTLRAGFQAYVFSHRSWYILHRELPPEPAEQPRSEFECRLATLDDLDALAVFEPLRKRREFREWIEEGSLIVVAFHDGRPVAFQRTSFKVPAGAPLSSLTLRPLQVWGADAQTLPAFRQRHAGAAIRTHRDHLLRERGYRETLGSVQSDNLPALSFGYGGKRRVVSRVERLDYLCLLGFRRIRLVKDALPALERLLSEAGLLPSSRA